MVVDASTLACYAVALRPIEGGLLAHRPPSRASRSRYTRSSSLVACFAKASQRWAIAPQSCGRQSSRVLGLAGPFPGHFQLDLFEPSNLRISCRFALKSMNIISDLYERPSAHLRLLFDRKEPATSRVAIPYMRQISIERRRCLDCDRSGRRVCDDHCAIVLTRHTAGFG